MLDDLHKYTHIPTAVDATALNYKEGARGRLIKVMIVGNPTALAPNINSCDGNDKLHHPESLQVKLQQRGKDHDGLSRAIIAASARCDDGPLRGVVVPSGFALVTIKPNSRIAVGVTEVRAPYGKTTPFVPITLDSVYCDTCLLKNRVGDDELMMCDYNVQGSVTCIVGRHRLCCKPVVVASGVADHVHYCSAHLPKDPSTSKKRDSTESPFKYRLSSFERDRQIAIASSSARRPSSSSSGPGLFSERPFMSEAESTMQFIDDLATACNESATALHRVHDIPASSHSSNPRTGGAASSSSRSNLIDDSSPIKYYLSAFERNRQLKSAAVGNQSSEEQRSVRRRIELDQGKIKERMELSDEEPIIDLTSSPIANDDESNESLIQDAPSVEVEDEPDHGDDGSDGDGSFGHDGVGDGERDCDGEGHGDGEGDGDDPDYINEGDDPDDDGESDEGWVIGKLADISITDGDADSSILKKILPCLHERKFEDTKINEHYVDIAWSPATTIEITKVINSRANDLFTSMQQRVNFTNTYIGGKDGKNLRSLKQEYSEIKSCCGRHVTDKSHPYFSPLEMVKRRLRLCFSGETLRKDIGQHILNRTAGADKVCLRVEGLPSCIPCYRASIGTSHRTMQRVQEGLSWGGGNSVAQDMRKICSGRDNHIMLTIVQNILLMIDMGMGETLPTGEGGKLHRSLSMPFTTERAFAAELVLFMCKFAGPDLGPVNLDNARKRLSATSIHRALRYILERHHIAISCVKHKKFMKCTACAFFDGERDRARGNATQLARVAMSRHMHLEQVQFERSRFEILKKATM